MKLLVVLVHADPSMVPRYQAAAGADVTVRAIVRPGLSSTYSRLAIECRVRGGGNATIGLLALLGLQAADFDAIVLATYSAGYAFARALTESERAPLLGLVSIDSAHAALDPDGTAADAGVFGVGWLVAWARDALAGRKVCFIGHSDVDPVTYASTTKVAQEAIRLAGAPGGLFVVRAHDVRPPAKAKEEHGAALTEWGPGFVGEAVAMVRGLLLAVPDTDPAPPPSSTAGGHVLPPRPLGERIADSARALLARGVAEVPGPASSPEVSAMLYPCRRGGTAVAGILDATGTRLGLVADAWAWCAATRSFVLFMAIDGTNDADRAACPHGYRISVAELVADGVLRGTWRDVRTGYRPQVGDAAVWMRAGGDPRKGGTGHVATVVAVSGDDFNTIGGNERDAVRLAQHDVHDPHLAGFIRASAT